MIETATSKYLSFETDLANATKVVEQFGRYPPFALLPLKWYAGPAMTATQHRLEKTMAKEFQSRHLKYCYSSFNMIFVLTNDRGHYGPPNKMMVSHFESMQVDKLLGACARGWACGCMGVGVLL